MSRGADPHSYSRDGGRARHFAHFEPHKLKYQYETLASYLAKNRQRNSLSNID